MTTTLQEALAALAPISLEEMSAVKLMNRVDTKYIAHRNSLVPLLYNMREKYYVQEIEGKRICPYHTIYLDTFDTKMFVDHHNARKVRQKIRIREYVDSNLFFFEIKNKNNRGRTKKKRITLESMEVYKDDTLSAFMEKYAKYHYDDLLPQLENFFDRITLVNKAKTERLTIDCNLRFHNLQTHQEADLSPIIVIELKQDGNARSESRAVLNDMRIHPYRISKYCIGSVLTNPALKSNRFKQKLHDINKLINKNL